MWPTTRSLMTWVLLHNKTHQPRSRSADRCQASAVMEHDCSDWRVIYLFILFFFPCSYLMWSIGLTGIFYNCICELLFVRLGVQLSEPTCVWLLPITLQFAVPTELPHFISLKKFRGTWILGGTGFVLNLLTCCWSKFWEQKHWYCYVFAIQNCFSIFQAVHRRSSWTQGYNFLNCAWPMLFRKLVVQVLCNTCKFVADA